MRISIICFSLTGYMTAEDLQKDLQGKGYTAEIYKKVNISMIRLRKVQESGQAAILRQMMRYFCRSLWNRGAQHCTLRSK